VVFRKIGNLLMIVAVLAATGSHWVMLQSVAWTAMLAGNLQERPLTEAVCCTFDGKHPCCLCKEIAAGKQSEKKSDIQVELKKHEFSYTAAIFVFTPPAFFFEARPAKPTATFRVYTPPVPPPRGAFICPVV